MSRVSSLRGRTLGAAYLIGAVSLSILFLTARGLSVPTGLTRSFYPNLNRAAEPSFQGRTRMVDLAFVEEARELPQRFFRVRWQGIWYSPRAEIIDLYAGADDRVEITVDDELVLRRGPQIGMGTISRAVELEPGAHRVSIDYVQRGGAYTLNVQWAPAGGEPGPMSTGRLFTVDPGALGYWITVILPWLQGVVVIAWLIGPVAVLCRWLWRGLARWFRAAAAISRRDVAVRLYTVGFPALLLASVPFLIGPHTVYAANLGEFALPFRALAVPWLLGVVVVVWAVLVVPGCVLSDRFVRVYSATLFGAGLLVWAQGNFWVGDYGVLDGNDIDFARLAGRVPYELGVWCVVLAGAITFGARLSRIAPFASQVFLGVQIAAILVGQSGEGRVQWVEPPPEIYQFSSQRNVIHLVLDEFQSDVLTEIVEMDRPWFDEHFGGFVYFADHAGAFPTTSLSMPAMLTGRIYRNDRAVPEFVRESFAEASIFAHLQRHGYEIDVVSILPGPWVDNWFPIAAGTDSLRMTIRKPYTDVLDYRRFSARQLIELSVFRHLPHLAKVALSDYPDWFTRVFWAESRASVTEERRHEARNSQAFFSHFIDNITVRRDRPLYKLIHLGIPHRPVVVDENCAFIGVTRFSREAYLGQSRCAVTLVASFLDRLRTLGVYDRSLIVISSDHGTSLAPRGFSGESGSLPLRDGETTARLTAIVGTAKAVMLVKPPGGNQPLVVSQAPTTHTDLPATISDILGLAGEFEATSMLDRDPTQPRRRVYGMYDVRQRFPETYLARLDVISIQRSLLDATGWEHERSILPPDVNLRAEAIDFGDEGATRHLGPGWSRRRTEQTDAGEVSFVWGLGRRAVAFASLPPGAIRLTARVSAAEARDKAIEVEVDDQALGRLFVRGDAYQEITLRIPADSNRPRISSIVFRFEPNGEAEAPGVKFDRMWFQPG